MKEVTKYGQFATNILRIPLQQLLKANRQMYTTEDTDHFIKNLKYVSLTREDVESIVAFASL